MEEEYLSVYEYEKNVNPNLEHVPFYEKDVQCCDYVNIYKLICN